MTILIQTTTEASLRRWGAVIAERAPDVAVRLGFDQADPAEITYAVVWKPPLGMLAKLPNLKAIQSLGAGVDHFIDDPDLPDVPIARLYDPWMTRAMTDYVVFNTLRFQRDMDVYWRQQDEPRWQEHLSPGPEDCRVGILGAGVLGSDAACRLTGLGYPVAVWSRTEKRIDGVESFYGMVGERGLDAFLARCDVLVCLLPLTRETEGILDRSRLQRLPRGAALINSARGHHVVDEDLLALLDSGHLRGAALDVFRTEPLPADHPYWSHPRVFVTPHVAARTNPPTAVELVLENYRRVSRGEDLLYPVDRVRGY